MKLAEDLASLRAEALPAIEAAPNESALDELRVKFLGKKGQLAAASAGMREVPHDKKAEAGQALNDCRGAITDGIEARKQALLNQADAAAYADLDLTLPGRQPARGALHPLTQIERRAVEIFRRLGFTLATGPEIEDEFHNFDALNTPADHPARNERDTFYFDDGLLLRTQTSSVQIRTMESEPPPLRIISPGTVYRRDEIDATHLSAFHQLEGLVVGPAGTITLADLKGTLETFIHQLLGPQTPFRFRPHFFPFTEPSLEIDAKMTFSDDSEKWVELLGCGMVDPAVFEAICDSRGDRIYDPEEVSGFAFGMGLERLAAILWGIPDIRSLIDNEQRFLTQFS